MENVPVSTKTMIATSNVQLDILCIFETLPLESKVKLMYYQNRTRGDDTLLKKKNKKCFRNAVNVIMEVGDKNVNFKLSKNGKFQLTGCKKEEHAIKAVSYFIEQLFRHCRNAIFLDPSAPEVVVYFQTVMTNIDFSLGFCVNRQKLDHLLNQETPFHSLLETSFGYTGVNIKFPLDIPWWKLEVPVIRMSLEDFGEWTLEGKSLESMTVLTPEQKKKKKYNTFLVFHSGNVIMSGMTKQTMKDHFDCFHSMIQQWRGDIEENLKN
jgi:TATA-box binding protein (TBP) (component of TFIID and TFIIIB)